MKILKLVVMLAWMLYPVAAAAPAPAWARQVGFPAQAVHLLRAVRLPCCRLRAVPRVLRDLYRVLQLHWPGSKLTPFGAIAAGLSMWDSDVDCFVTLPNRTRALEGVIFETQGVLDRHPLLFRRPTAVLTAKMPHVRVVHAPTGHQCDVSFGSLSAVRNTALLTYLMRLDKRALDLTTIVKYWAKVHKPLRARRIMSNYAMVSLVIFYLQQVNVLPPIAYLQENAKTYIVDYWETGFDEMSSCSSNNDTLLELLGGFFKYYDKFDFENTIVSVFTGTKIKRSVFRDVDVVPEVFSLYKRNVGGNGLEPLDIKMAICIQDVFIHNENLAESSSPKMLATFKTNLKFAAEAFMESRNEFLKIILQECEELQVLTNKQTWMNNWSNATSQSCWKVCE